jgi:flagella basal body P-ring formation protein FlgA
MKKRFIFLALLACGFGVFAPGALAMTAAPVMLRGQTVIDERIIRLGDLFSGVGDELANQAIAYAPDPGRKAVFDSRWLYKVARAYGLDWRPLTIEDQAVIERASTVIGREEVEARVKDTLLDKGISDDIKVELSNSRFEIHLPEGSPTDLEIEGLSYNQRSDQFTATVVASAVQNARYRIAGRVHHIREIPVLIRRVLSDEIIREGDIEWISVRADRLRRDTLFYSEELVGKSPVRALRAGQPIRTREVQDPILVPRRSLVTILYQHPRMTLTAKGRALEDGSDGQVIRISNSQSSNVIEAVVVGDHTVAVSAPNHVVMN